MFIALKATVLVLLGTSLLSATGDNVVVVIVVVGDDVVFIVLAGFVASEKVLEGMILLTSFGV